MTDEWKAFRSAAPSDPAASDQWKDFRPEDKPLEAPPVADQEPSTFADRRKLGDQLLQALGPFGPAIKIADALLGITGPRYVTDLEKSLRYIGSIPHDVAVNNELNGPVTENPIGSTPMDRLAQKGFDLAGAVLSATTFPKILPFHPTPLIRTSPVEIGRIAPADGGGLQTQAIGPAPTPKTFETAASHLGDPAVVEPRLKELWQERGVHPAEAAHDASIDPFAKHELTAAAEPHPLGAEVTSLPPDVPLTAYPAAPSGGLRAAFQDAAANLFDIGRDIQMQVTPMAVGSNEARVAAKDFAIALRKNRWDWDRLDTNLEKNFTPEQRARMWNAMDEESVMAQTGEKSDHMGLATLDPAERAAVEDLSARSQNAWLLAHEMGIVKGWIPYYVPRMAVKRGGKIIAEDRVFALDSFGHNLRTTTKNTIKRDYLTAEETEAAIKAKYGKDAMLARDIRSLPLATAKLEDAIAGRTLIDEIKKSGTRAGTETVAEGFKPVDGDFSWFTIDHPAFRVWRPKFGEKTAAGEQIFEQVPLYVRSDFEGPLRAVLMTKTGPVYRAAMEMKSKVMSLIMNSPLIHNAVEYGRAFMAMPVKMATFKTYRDGYVARQNEAIMHDAIDHGLVPIGKRFFNQDINSIMEAPSLQPGRSLTAKLLAAVPDLFSPNAGAAVRRSIDKAGDFWHNTLLWDRIADLQMGLYVNFKDSLATKGIDTNTASYVAAHLANRFAGALPRESMSQAATKFANFLAFSRTFTVGNLGVFKDALTGLPKDIQALIERDIGTFDPAARDYAKSLARRKAIVTLAADIGLFYAGNSILQNALNIMLGDKTLSEEMHGYVRRYRDLVTHVEQHPLSLLQPFDLAERLSSTYDNEPGKKDRLRIGTTQDGRGIYAKSPFGKIGEEFVGWPTAPISTATKKTGTVLKPLLDIFHNDAGFGHKIYDPTADTPAKYAGNVWGIVKHFFAAQTPEGQITAFSDMVKGDGDPTLTKLQAFGPLTGFTFSQGAPGGPAMGEIYASKEAHDFAVDQAMPDIRKLIQRGELGEATQRMNALGIPRGLQQFYVRSTLNPATRMSSRTLREFFGFATDEQKERFLQQQGTR